jgi:dipeptidyl aminopeptidase/acylaminoacyl peptidase
VENVSLVTFFSEGHKIFGNLHLPSENVPCIICLHGLESDKDGNKWLTFASKFFDENYSCLRFSFRGCGEGFTKSEGNFEDVSLTSRIKDLQSALDFLKETKRIDMNRIGLVGSSLGGMVALAVHDIRIKAIVTLGSPYQIPRSNELFIPEENGDYYTLPSGRIFRKSFYEDLKKYDLLEAVKISPPIMIVHGDSDEIVPLGHAQKLYEAASEPKKIKIIKSADHAFSRSDFVEQIYSLAVNWFKKYL